MIHNGMMIALQILRKAQTLDVVMCSSVGTDLHLHLWSRRPTEELEFCPFCYGFTSDFRGCHYSYKLPINRWWYVIGLISVTTFKANAI